MPSALMSYICAAVGFSKLCPPGEDVSQAGYTGEPKLQDTESNNFWRRQGTRLKETDLQAEITKKCHWSSLQKGDKLLGKIGVLNLLLSKSNLFSKELNCAVVLRRLPQKTSREVTIWPKRTLQDEADKCTGYCNPGPSVRPGKLEPSSQGGRGCALRDQNIGQSNSSYKHQDRAKGEGLETASSI